MKRLLHAFSLFSILLIYTPDLMGQVIPPYALSPRWVFGNKCYFDFTSGGAAPAQPVRTETDIIGYEGNSTLCDSTKALAIYTNNVRIAGANFTANGTLMTSSTSSTQGGVIFPNPANPYGQFFILAGNAEATYVAGDQAVQGLRLYTSNKTLTSVTAPTEFAGSPLETNANKIKENACVGVNDTWGYWALASNFTTSAGAGRHWINAWPISNAGALGARVLSSDGLFNDFNPDQYHSSIKINRCQNRLAFVTGNWIKVFEWNRNTGQVGAALVNTNATASPGGKYYGCEFSENGDYLYITSLNGGLIVRVYIPTATITTMAGTSASGTLQLAPNGTIYVANGFDGSYSSNVGTITDADIGGTYNATGVALANTSQSRLGISNLAWLQPRRPYMTYSVASCLYTFTPHFLTYFKDVIDIDRAEWNFGDGSPNVVNTGANAYDPVDHGFPNTTSKTITLTVRDATCGHSFVGTYTLTPTCPLPVDLISFTGLAEDGSVRLNWTTASEINNDYFDVQRSANGETFETIAQVDGRGNSNTLAHYNYLDTAPEGDHFYYRLIQHDFDGKSATSNIVSVRLEGLQLVVSPNPSGSEFNINIANAEPGSIKVYSLPGTEVFSAETSTATTHFTFGKELSKGYYILKYTSGSESKSYKLEKL